MRNYGRFTTSIFRDDDFRALTAAEQGVYFLLGLQPDVSAAGTLPLTIKRWASMSAEMTPEELSETLASLAEHGHVVVDWDTEELLITKFIKWDGGVGNEKRRPVILEAGCAISSERIRHRIAYELARLDQPDMASRISPEGLSDAQSRFDRVVVKQGDHIPQPLNPDPQPATHAPVAEATRAELALVDDQPTAQALVGEWIDHCNKRPPETVIGHVARAIRAMLAEGIDPNDIRRGIAAWMSKGLHPSTLPSVVNEVMNARPGRQSRQQDETDAMFERAARRLGVVTS